VTRAAVLAPGYGGTAEQPILRALSLRLARFDIASRAVTFRSRGRRPSREYATELEDLRSAREALRADHDKIALVGRSFGGRMCAFLAALEPPDALAILGPLAVLQRIALGNPLIDLAVIEGAGHDLGAKESEAVEQAARWLDATLR
jgi:predicted alpha/beta-hydrolase family hydrolase